MAAIYTSVEPDSLDPAATPGAHELYLACEKLPNLYTVIHDGVLPLGRRSVIDFLLVDLLRGIALIQVVEDAEASVVEALREARSHATKLAVALAEGPPGRPGPRVHVAAAVALPLRRRPEGEWSDEVLWADDVADPAAFADRLEAWFGLSRDSYPLGEDGVRALRRRLGCVGSHRPWRKHARPAAAERGAAAGSEGVEVRGRPGVGTEAAGQRTAGRETASGGRPPAGEAPPAPRRRRAARGIPPLYVLLGILLAVAIGPGPVLYELAFPGSLPALRALWSFEAAEEREDASLGVSPGTCVAYSEEGRPGFQGQACYGEDGNWWTSRQIASVASSRLGKPCRLYVRPIQLLGTTVRGSGTICEVASGVWRPVD